MVCLGRIREGPRYQGRTNHFPLSRLVCWFCVFREIRADALRLSSSKVFPNVGNLGRHRKKIHNSLYHFPVHFTRLISSSSLAKQPGLVVAQGAQLLCDHTAAVVLRMSRVFSTSALRVIPWSQP